MPTHSQFLEEAFRVLKPGGQLLILELTQPKTHSPKTGESDLSTSTILPLVSSAFGRDKQAYNYLAGPYEHFQIKSRLLRPRKAWL